MKREEGLNDPEEATRAAQDGHQARIWTGLPGIIDGVDLDAQTVSVQPAIQGRLTVRDPSTGKLSEKLVNMPLLIHVPIVWPQGGGFVLTFPIKPGDECFVSFSARAIDSWWQSGKVQAPVERRMHDLSDGFAHVGVRSQARKLSGISAEAVQLRNDDGTCFIEINDAGDANVKATGKITAKAGGDLEAEAGGKATLKASTEIVLEAPIVRLKSPAIDMNGIAWATHFHETETPPDGMPVPG